jgi:hypothetical protein
VRLVDLALVLLWPQLATPVQCLLQVVHLMVVWPTKVLAQHQVLLQSLRLQLLLKLLPRLAQGTVVQTSLPILPIQVPVQVRLPQLPKAAAIKRERPPPGPLFVICKQGYNQGQHECSTNP